MLVWVIIKGNSRSHYLCQWDRNPDPIDLLLVEYHEVALPFPLSIADFSSAVSYASLLDIIPL